MISKILFLVFTAALFIVPMCLYKSRKSFMAKFYLRMTAQATARKFYRMVLLIILLSFHFLYLSVQFVPIDLLLSTLLIAAFYMKLDADRCLHALHEKRKAFCVVAIITLAFALTTHLYTTAVTLAFILLAAMFYPSREVLDYWDNDNDRKVLLESPDLLYELYY